MSPTITYYYTTWCPWCKKMNPIWNEVKNEMGGQIVFLDMDVTNTPPPSDIKSFPTILLQKQGRIYKYNNKYSAKDLKEWINSHMSF